MSDLISKALKWGAAARESMSKPQEELHQLRGANQILECDRAELAGEVQRLREALDHIRKCAKGELDNRMFESQRKDWEEIYLTADEALSPQKGETRET